jgi:PAS domain S-box-containing protein
MKKIARSYDAFIRSRLNAGAESNDRDLHFWQDQLFYNFLVYCLPVSLFALIPGVFMALKEGVVGIAVVDMACFLLVLWITLFTKMPMRFRKGCIVGIFYFLSVFLINTLGYLGPGVFYLFFVTVLAALIFPIRYAYWSVLLNAVILLFFAAIIWLKLFNSALIAEYTPGKWIAFSGNLIFASIVIVILIGRIFESLQLTITNQSQLQERYKSIFDKSPLPMWLFDTETLQFIDVNEAAMRHYGYNKAEFLSMTIKDIRTAESVPAVENIVKANKISGAYYDGNSQHLKKNGETIYVKIESNLLQFNDRPVRLVLATDITQQVEDQLEIFNSNLRIKESESNLRAIFESALDGFVLLDSDFRIKIFNTRASESMRFNKDQSVFEIGRSIFDYVELSRLTYFKEIIEKVYSGQTIDYDRRYQGKDGSKAWIRYTLTAVREGGVVTGVCINGRDVTARKLYLKNLEDQNKTFREISWMQSHLVRAPLARIMGLMPLFTGAADHNERVEIRSLLEISTKDLDDIIMQITEKSNNILQSFPRTEIAPYDVHSRH